MLRRVVSLVTILGLLPLMLLPGIRPNRSLTAQDATRSPVDDDEDPLQPGLLAEYVSLAPTAASNSPKSTTGRVSIRRIDAEIAFTWRGDSPDRRLPRGAFRAQWHGVLRSQTPGTHRLYVYAAGSVDVSLGTTRCVSGNSPVGKWFVSPPIELEFGDHELKVTYESAGKESQCRLFWTGPQFQLEPISGKQLFHDGREASPALAQMARGELLVRALRCAACHDIAGEAEAIPAPSLDRLAGNLHFDWLVEYLQQHPADSRLGPGRRMPGFSLNREESQNLAAFLWRRKEAAGEPSGKSAKLVTDSKSTSAEGERLFLTLGCLACHARNDLAPRDMFDGGDLSRIAWKRPAEFFDRWLAAPETVNAKHRMPRFELSQRERGSLVLHLANLGRDAEPSQRSAPPRDASAWSRGQELYDAHRCASCHAPDAKDAGGRPAAPKKIRLTRDARWADRCLGASGPQRQHPGYRLDPDDAAAVREFISALPTDEPDGSTVRDAPAGPPSEAMRIRELNCLACHARGWNPGIGERLPALAEQHPELAEFLPAMSPPSLNSVGDKLVDDELLSIVTGKSPARRPWLKVRMPKFSVSAEQARAVVAYLVDQDRLPESPPEQPVPFVWQPASAAHQLELELAASRLVTPDGFGCTSCHQVGNTIPAKAPLNALAPDLSQLAKRIRRSWYDRWVRNPARIVPRMEMPSVQIPVRGVLDQNLDHQLAAVWFVLNQPGFQPPKPNPVRTLRRTGGVAANAREPGSGRSEASVFLTDVIHAPEQVYLKPLLIGLPNRHNVLFDLETNRLAAWWIGDAAFERTEGKTWYWEPGSRDLLRSGITESDLALVVQGRVSEPKRRGQFVTEFESISHASSRDRGGLEFTNRLSFNVAENELELAVQHRWEPLGLGDMGGDVGTAPTKVEGGAIRQTGFRHVMEFDELPRNAEVVVRLLAAARVDKAPGSKLQMSSDRRTLDLADSGLRIQVREPDGVTISPDGSLRFRPREGRGSVVLDYVAHLPVFAAAPSLPALVSDVASLPRAVPGFEALRLGLPTEIMPTGLAAGPDGYLAVTSLKGDVWRFRDSDGDGHPEVLDRMCDGLAAPYGVLFEDGVDSLLVINKYNLMRIRRDEDGLPQLTRLASGWGHTVDYHDWAVGLVRDEHDQLYVALPCQQDKRSPEAAALRGEVLRLIPDTRGEPPHAYRLETVSRGHRFPMGIARNRRGELFVSDNQGNYNPFNELNHVVPGAHFGFINAVEKEGEQKDAVRPKLAPPAIDIPHPWTRSVNGICFLESAGNSGSMAQDRKQFGPFAGHLIGCEYDTRRLIRMTLQRVGGTLQGAAYPFSVDGLEVAESFLGPVVCCVSPSGDIFVGGIRDSGWGAGNNIGEVVRLRCDPENIPAGIAEMRATSSGFHIEFTRPVDRQMAGLTKKYSLSSYTRQSTPAYGGADLDRREEPIQEVVVSDDAHQVHIRPKELRAGYVYELHIENVMPGGGLFFPAEAHYTLRHIPQ